MLTSVGDMYGDPFAEAWPGFDPAHIGYVFTLRLRPGETRALMTFVVKGLSEVYDPRGGYPTSLQGCVGDRRGGLFRRRRADTGSRIGDHARLRDCQAIGQGARSARPVSALQRSQIANWSIPVDVQRVSRNRFSVFEKSIAELQEAMTTGALTSEDVTREYLARLSRFDRNGPTFRSVLSINPRAIADARARDAERAAGRVRSPFHGVPIVLKDNIDATELPIDRRLARAPRSSSAPRLTRRRRHEERRRRHPRQSQSRRVPVR